jgi:hypothetical protein
LFSTPPPVMADVPRQVSAAGLAQQRRNVARSTIYAKRKKMLEQVQKKRPSPPPAPVDALEVLRELYAAAHEVWQQLRESPDDWSEGWNDYVKQIGAAIREGHLHDPLVQAYLDGQRPFGVKHELDRYKNYVGRLSRGVQPMCSHVDLWIAFHAAPMREQGASVTDVRTRLTKLLPKNPLPEGMSTDVESLTEVLLAQKCALHPEPGADHAQRLLAEMTAIGWIWQADIAKRLGTDENLRQQLLALGIEVMPDDENQNSSKKTRPIQRC